MITADVPGAAITFRELAIAAAEVAAGLRDRGLGGDDRVVAVLSSGPPFLAVALGTLAAGLTFVPLHPAWWPRELEATVELASPALVVADAALGKGALLHLAHLPVSLPASPGASTDPGAGEPGSDPLLSALRRREAAVGGPLVGEGAGLVLATTGSTAEPRLFEFTTEQVRRFWMTGPTAHRRDGNRNGDGNGHRSGSDAGAVVVWTPLAHAATLRFTLQRLTGGATIVTTSRWTAKRAADSLRGLPVDELWATTPQLLAVRRRLLPAAVEPDRAVGVPLVRRAVYAGGGLIDRPRRARLAAVFGAPVVAVYTATEAGGWVTELPDPSEPTEAAPTDIGPGGADNRAGERGRAPVVGRVAAGLTVAANHELPTDAGTEEPAPLYVSGPAAAVASIGGPRRSPAGWPLGDLGIVDGDRIHLVGRVGDRFRCGTAVVDSALAELRLAGDDRLDDVAVIPRPDAERGAIAVAVTVPADPEHPPFLHELRGADDGDDHEPETADPWPEAQWVVDALPLSVAGQVHRRLLAFEESSR